MVCSMVSKPLLYFNFLLFSGTLVIFYTTFIYYPYSLFLKALTSSNPHCRLNNTLNVQKSMLRLTSRIKVLKNVISKDLLELLRSYTPSQYKNLNLLFQHITRTLYSFLKTLKFSFFNKSEYNLLQREPSLTC